jgi:hypothetical protein
MSTCRHYMTINLVSSKISPDLGPSNGTPQPAPALLMHQSASHVNSNTDSSIPAFASCASLPASDRVAAPLLSHLVVDATCVDVHWPLDISSTAFSKVLGMIFFWLFFTLVTFFADACDSAYGRVPYSYSTLRRRCHDIKTISLVHLQECSPRVTPTHDR